MKTQRDKQKSMIIFLLWMCFAFCGCDALREQQIPDGFPQASARPGESQSTAPKKSPPREIAGEKPRPSEPGGIETARGLRRIATVDRIIDGDTIHLSTGEKVRYIGVDTPELGRDGKHPEFYAGEATECNRRLLGTGPIKLVFDRGREDKYGRLLAYVYSGAGFKTFVNAGLLRQGCARVMSVPPNTRHAGVFRDIEADAKKRQAGLWAD